MQCLDLDSETRKDANEIILQGSTNDRIYRNVLGASESMFNVDDDQGDTSEVVYTLSMVEQILHNSSDDQEESKGD